MAFCSKCGRALMEAAKFCGSCGSASGDQQIQPLVIKAHEGAVKNPAMWWLAQAMGWAGVAAWVSLVLLETPLVPQILVFDNTDWTPHGMVLLGGALYMIASQDALGDALVYEILKGESVLFECSCRIRRGLFGADVGRVVLTSQRLFFMRQYHQWGQDSTFDKPPVCSFSASLRDLRIEHVGVATVKIATNAHEKYSLMVGIGKTTAFAAALKTAGANI